jgi:hypothetical protein
MMRRAVATAAATLVLLLGPATSDGMAQDEAPGVTLQDPQIIPEPNSGVAPKEAGDRGGALQFTILGVVVVAVGGAVGHLVRQSRRARTTT